MDVHARRVVLKEGFGHKRRRLAVFASGVLNHVLVDHQVVGHASQRRIMHVDFGLTGRRHLMMMGLDAYSQLFQFEHHLGAKVLHAVDRGCREISFFLSRLVAEVRLLLSCRVPDALLRIDFVARVVDALSVAYAIEDEEFRLRTEIGRIGKARALQVDLGLLGDVTRVATVRLSGDRVPDVADEDQGLLPL